MARPTGLLVLIHGGGVERAVAGGERVGDGLLGLFSGDLVDAEAENRHPYAVVEGDRWGRVRHGTHYALGPRRATHASRSRQYVTYDVGGLG